MLIDRYDRIGEYTGSIANLQNALDFIVSKDSFEPGRYEFEGGYILYQEQNTKAVDDGTYENHNKYVDIQVLLDGENWSTLWNRVEEMEEAVPYDPVKDATRWNGEGAVITLQKGMFVCFFPSDAHKPDRFLPGGEASPYKKYVIKLEIPEKF
jgi:biofilm protein TabA